ncbi:MAG: ATP-binding protein [Myxococcota bacterium]
MEAYTATVLVVSIGLQLVAAVMALRLIRLSLGSGTAWILLASAMVLMASRRIVTMVGLVRPGVEQVVRGPVAETTALVVAILMVMGVGRIPAIFRQRDELIQQARALAEANRLQAVRLRTILDNLVDAVIVSDAQGMVALANPAARRLFGLPDNDTTAQPLGDFIGPYRIRNPDGSAVVYEELPLARALAGEVVIDADTIQHRPTDGRDIHARNAAAPIRDEAGRIVGAVAVSRDVTEQMEFERLKDQFVGVAAHELKTPVAIMKGYAQALMRTDQTMSADVTRRLAAIDRGADRIERIVEDLLMVSELGVRQLAMRVEPVDLAAIVGEALTTVSPRAPRHSLKLLTTMPAVVSGDRERLRQTMIRLLDNAVKFSPQGGDVEIAITVDAGEAVVSVKDHGVGIAEDRQARIFDRFYRAHTDTPYDCGGMGVGLYLAKKVVTQLGGRVGFESEPGRGSAFWFSLPVQAETQRGKGAAGRR